MHDALRFVLRCSLLVAVCQLPLRGLGNEPQAGHLLIIGGGLRPDNSAIFNRLIQYAGGKESARFGILPTASTNTTDARQMKLILHRLGIPENQIQVLGIFPENAEQQAANPAMVEQIRSCTGVFIEGGDQTRITRALFKADGTETPALAALREVWKRGAVVAGTSAGAAVQCETMISVAGLPDDALDEGMDALDFGLTANRFQRGLFVSRGLAFFQAGVIDQHFNQYRGRLGRLARVTVEKKIPFGFGIDENTALDVSPDGSIEVVGAGTVIVVDSTQAKIQDGPLGCRISGILLSCLEQGDRFVPKTDRATPHPAKKPMVQGKEEFNGNFLIPDINGPQGPRDAILLGLADNTARKLAGVALKHNRHFAHGYLFTFHKIDETECYEGYVDGLYANTVLGVRLDVEPVLNTLEAPEKRLPKDLPESEPIRTQLAALYYRGILLADDDRRLRPEAEVTRAELAGVIAKTICLEPLRRAAPRIADLDETTPFANDIALVVGAKFMELDRDGNFHPLKTVSRQEGAVLLVRLAERYRAERLPAEPVEFADHHRIAPPNRPAVFAAIRFGLLKKTQEVVLGEESLTREMLATAICKIIGFSWEAEHGR